MQNKKLRKLKTVLAVLLLTFTISSITFSVIHHDHHCNDNDCVICFIIQNSETNLKLLRFSAGLIFAAAVFSFVAFKLNQSEKYYSVNTQTLISQKIRLNN